MFYRKVFVEWYRCGLFLAAILYLQVDKSCSQVFITSQPRAPNEGETVTLLIKYDGKIQMVNWYRGNATLNPRIILTYNPNSPEGLTTGPEFNNRMKVLANGSLQISNAAASDSGDYTLQVTDPNFHAERTFPLTVNSVSQTPPLNTHPVNQGNIQTSPITRSPPLVPDGETKDGNKSALIGIIIGSLAAVILVVSASVIWYRRGCNKPKQSPFYNDEKPTAVSSSSENISSPMQNNVNRRLPSVPPRPTVYQNENNNGIKENEEDPYTDLTYIYLSGSYHDLKTP